MTARLLQRLAQFSLALSLLILSSRGALADWQATRWGMTIAEAIAATPNAMEVAPKEVGQVGIIRAKFPWKSGRFEFDRLHFFHSENKRLISVELRLTDFKLCQDLRYALAERYGIPQQQKDANPVWSAEWFVERTTIVWFRTLAAAGGGSSCQVFYKSRSNPDSDGL